MTETIYKEEEIDGVMMKVPYIQDIKNAVLLTNRQRVKDILLEHAGEDVSEILLAHLEAEDLIK